MAYIDGVLDVQIAQILSQGIGRVHGIDSSKAMIEAAKEKCGGGAGSEKCSFEGMSLSPLFHQYVTNKDKRRTHTYP